MLTAILLIGVSLIACARARADKLFQGIPINSNTCQAHRKRSVQSKVLNIVLFLIALFFIFIYLFPPNHSYLAKLFYSNGGEKFLPD